MSVRGAIEALKAAKGGAAIADVEFPASALGTPYPLNIRAVRDRLRAAGFKGVRVSTNIGENQPVRATACQAALGVAVAGADYIKFGLAGLDLDDASYLGKSIVRTVRHWFPSKKCYPAVFVDDDLRRNFDPIAHGPSLAARIRSDGLLIDTYNKDIGKGLLDYVSLRDVRLLVNALHKQHRAVWVAGSITVEQLPELWKSNVDVVCVRRAACALGTQDSRFEETKTSLVRQLVSTVPGHQSP